MNGLDLTYETLGNTRNEAAADVLVAALGEPESGIRGRALSTLLSRTEERAAELMLENWDLLTSNDLQLLRTKKKWITAAIKKALRGEGEGEGMSRGIDAAKSLGLAAVIPNLVLLAESSASRSVRAAVSDAVIDIAEPLGRDARADRDQRTIRGPVLRRLVDSVRRFSMHGNEKLVDAFLLVTTWGDGDFRQLTSEGSPQLDLICKRLRVCHHDSINDLLAGFIRRRSVPPRIGEILQGRDDGLFHESLLESVGSDPSATVLRNLADIGMPQSCQGGETLMQEIAPGYRAALAHVYSAADADPLHKLHVVASAVELGGPGCDTAAAICFSRCGVPGIDVWMRAAISVATGDSEAIENDESSRLLQRLMHLLDHPNAVLVESVRHILAPLHADAMLHQFESLRQRSRRRLGRIVMTIDPNAIQRVRDALRHPVLSNRLAAIATADALAAVDLLSDAFQHISREDHQKARIQAADVMSHAGSEATLALLREMVNMPESAVRDAAVAALQRRKNAVS